MSADKQKRKLASILCAGAEGYGRLMGEDESGTLAVLKAHLQLIGSLVEKHEGRVLAVHGDTLLAGFDSVVDALQCAVETQNELKEKNEKQPEASRMPFRIGINLGDVIEEKKNHRLWRSTSPQTKRNHLDYGISGMHVLFYLCI